MDEVTQSLPEHVQETVRSSAELHDRHNNEKTIYQRVVDEVTAKLGEPAAISIVISIVVIWILANLFAPMLHIVAFDPAPFHLLEAIAAITGLCFAVLILCTQRHENQLAEQRARLVLELAMVNDKKVAKLIAMLEQQRRDNPLIKNAVDHEATDMAKPADPHVIFEAIKDRQP